MFKYVFTVFLSLGFSLSLSGQAFNMTLEGTWDNTSYTYNDCWGYTDENGNEYAIIGSRSRISFVDITIPTAPSLVAEFTGSFTGISGANSIWRDIKVYDRYAYSVADQGSEGLMVFDMSDIHNGNVTKVNQLNNRFTRSHNIFIDVPEGKLYAVGPDTPGTPNDNIVVYDIKDDPSNPVFLSSVSVAGGYIHDAYVQDNILYGSSGYDGLYIFDMVDPVNPVFKSFEQSTAAGYNHSGWPFDNGDKMLVAEEVPQGLKLAIFDISDLNNISFLSDFRDPILTNVSGNVTYHNPFMLDDYAVISSYEDGITIMDLSNTSAPFRAAHYDTFSNSSYAGYEGTWGAYPYFPSGSIIGSDIVTGLYVLSTTLSLTNTCTNGIQDDFEIDVDCGGFCNTCVCSAPTDMSFTDISNTSIQIDWTSISTAVGYEIRYRLNGSTAWTTITTTSNTATISGLAASSDYNFQIRADCGNRMTPFATSVTYQTGACLLSAQYAGPQDGSFVTAQFIRSVASVPANNDVSYFTGDSIMLGVPFMVDLNAEFIAEVNTPCGIPSFTGQSQNQKYVNLEPIAPEGKFTVVENKEEQVFYIVSNTELQKSYVAEILDNEGDLLHSFTQPDNQTLVKLENKKKQAKLIIREGDKKYQFSLSQ